MPRRADFRLPWLVLKGTITKFFRDDGPFLASGLAFDLLLSCIPFALLIISAMGYTVLESDRALAAVQSVLQHLLPRSHQAFTENLASIVANRGLLGVVGLALLFLLSSVMFGSVLVVLNTVFEVRQQRSYFGGKGMDFLMVLSASGLLLLTVGIGFVLGLLQGLGEHVPALRPLFRPGWILAGSLVTFLSTMVLFYVLYRYCPVETLSRHALVLAAFIGAGLFELSKWAFTWYVAIAEASLAASFFGTLGGLLFFLLWLYYAALVFILSATAGWVFDRRKTS